MTDAEVYAIECAFNALLAELASVIGTDGVSRVVEAYEEAKGRAL
ncbi:hypothetical protein SEA_VANLEE_75 [Gordonia phage VanLee]|uniref:Uncharacterized protein n=1 Tax=Gordonia phage VanLee TaxID=2845816 RepID=A0A8F2DAD9_9CAUD|nr:hypothetical protein QEH49_gp075 [Gordonia phage VanLee]QWS68192.1 hypothetical protein SEA_VANLEE_75 [Gordonia phage VanLee]